MSSRAIKKEILSLLQDQEFESIMRRLDDFPAKERINVLFSAICREDPKIKWFSISAMGYAVSRLAKHNLEEARIIMRRLLWSLNDESGGIGWGAPEAMAEIMCAQKQLAQEYWHMLVSYMREDGEELHQDGNFLEHPLLQRGLLWGIGRLGACHPEILQGRLTKDDFQIYFDSPDTEVRGLAAWASGNNKITGAMPSLRQLTKETSTLTLYQNGLFYQTTVGKLAVQALQEVDQ